MSARWPRHAWWLAAAAALLVLLALALVGPDRQSALGEHVAGGPLRHVEPQAVQRAELTQGPRSATLERDGATRWRRNGQPLDDALAQRVEVGLRLLHNTPPEREFDAAQAEYGLATPSLTVVLHSAGTAPVTLAFGATNPIGLARYTHVQRGGDANVVLLPSDVHDAWAGLLP
jgi:hypothetical protein